MRGAESLVTLNHKILRPCRKLLIRITKSCPRRHNRHLKLKKASSSSNSSGNKVTKVVALFFLSFHKKKQKKEKMKRLNELRSFSHAVSDQKKKKVQNQESSKKKVFPSRLTMSWLGQGKGNSNTQEVPQDHDPRRDSTSAFIP
ncbi:hypothetical protein EUTSA_v10017387mg [Eutrema salsugineum]|uniref:Uncharacterized protein n=1 Tax=Eutrema salsugineum TaxID=72664 RepID=V4M6Z2_EUTSA|nr:uncharacterized protein LOC18027003 [Eutrema salsugineum]ESQ52029.1 hypothetical protein EUTSA_v10017387mg [Eutrema salsugineum]